MTFTDPFDMVYGLTGGGPALPASPGEPGGGGEKDPPLSPGADSAHPPLESLRHPLTRVLLALTFSTGLGDAAGYLRLGHVFAANMTGNVMLLGFGIAGSGGLPVVAPIVSLAGFLLGAQLDGRLGSRAATGRARPLAAALTLEAGMLLAATVVAAVGSMLVGALAGGLLQKASLTLVLAAATAIAIALLTLGACRTDAVNAPLA